MEELWPYILPLPTKSTQQYKVLLSIFKYKASPQILKSLSVDKPPYSNKTVIQSLNTLVAAGILEEGMKKIVVKGKVVWVKWYKPTSLGKWLVLFLIPLKQIPRSEVERTLKELFEFYVKSTINFCVNYGIDPKSIKKTFEETYRQAVAVYLG
jgi:hypothetical protein